MGSATREALANTREALGALGSVDLATGEQLLSAGRIIGDSAPLLSALLDATIEPAAKRSIVQSVFSGYSAGAQTLLSTVVSSAWSSSRDLLAGVEEIGFRVLARSAQSSTSIENELFTFGTAVSSDPELELAVSSKLGSPESKAALVRALLGGGSSSEALAILEHLVQQPRNRRIGELLGDAASVIADERGSIVATVTTAAPIASEQLTRLSNTLGSSYGRDIHINHVVDPAVVGGLRVQIGDDVIDGTVASRLTDLRLKLAS